MDSEIVNYTWKYVNRDGGRDLSFSNNKKYSVCKYGEILFKSPNGINTSVEFIPPVNEIIIYRRFRHFRVIS